VIHFKPISVKDYLLKNNYYAVELPNPYDTIQDVLGIIFNYVGLDGQDCPGKPMKTVYPKLKLISWLAIEVRSHKI